MARQHMFKAQFQAGRISVSRQRNITKDRPITTSEACGVLDNLRSEVDSAVSNRDVRQKAYEAINSTKDRIRSYASSGITGNGFSQNLWPSKSFTVNDIEYRVDVELSGDIKG